VKKAGRDSEISSRPRWPAVASRWIWRRSPARTRLGRAVRRHAAQDGGFESWIVSNIARGAGGASGGFTAGNTQAPTDGTPRASTEALLKTVIKAAWNAGGKPNLLLMGSTQKQNFSGFTGIATQFQEPKGKMATVIGAVDRCVSDFGTPSAVGEPLHARREIRRSSIHAVAHPCGCASGEGVAGAEPAFQAALMTVFEKRLGRGARRAVRRRPGCCRGEAPRRRPLRAGCSRRSRTRSRPSCAACRRTARPKPGSWQAIASDPS